MVVGTTAWAAPEALSFGELYKSRTVLGMEFGARTRALAGKTVRMLGYMAPPLKADARFFVLTRAPVSVCPFCSSDADWPSDIVVVTLADSTDFPQDGTPVAVTGTLEVGSSKDNETGFVSLLRITNAQVERYR
jgi:hypothetical protein